MNAKTAVVIGTILAPAAMLFGTIVQRSDLARAAITLAFVASGGLIGRWWAPLPAVATITAWLLAEEANHWGFGPGTRLGTAIEIHSGGDFSFAFFAMMTAIATALSLAGLAIRRGAAWLLHRIGRGYARH